MVIDSSAVVNLPYDSDIKVKKKENAQKVKPVDDPGKGNEPELNINKDKVTKKTPEMRKFDTGEIYNQNGSLKDNGDLFKDQEVKEKTVDIVI